MADLGGGIDEAGLDLSRAQVTPNEGGGATVDFDPQSAPAAASDDMAFNADLTPLFTDQYLMRLGGELKQQVEEDDRSRAPWKTSYARGLNLLGLQYEERTEPWEGACGAFHPMLLESIVRFNAQEMMDIFPPAGPVKTDIVGRITADKEAQAKRVRTDMNWLLLEKMKGYREETDMMLFNLPLAGSTFRKFHFDARRKRPAAEYVLTEHVIMPYSAASLDTTERYAVVLEKSRNWIDAKMRSGFFRQTTVAQPAVVATEITEEKDRIEGRTNTSTARNWLYRLYEVNIDYFFEEDPLNTSEAPVPYVVTIDSGSTKVVAIRRNWKENDPAFERQVSLVQHKYMPGFGPYGTGLIAILGGLTESATSILRQLIDAGTLSNLPAGYKTKEARIKDDSTPIGPGEWRDVEVGMDTLREAFFPLPYKEPSTVLYQLLGGVVDEGRRLGSVADMKITDMTGQNMPVGTTLAIIERSMKVMSAVQQRLYDSFKQEYRVLAEIVKDFMPDVPYAFEIETPAQSPDATQPAPPPSRKTDYDYQKVAVIPVADPNASTMAQRIMVMQAIIQLTQTAPNIYNLQNVHRDMITVLGSDKADYYIPPPAQVLPADPVTENMRVLTSQPVKAGVMQDHEAHIQVHLMAMQDPKLTAMLQNNPTAPSITAAMNAHILEHLSFQYRQDIEAQLGTQLPPPDQPLPPEVEYQISALVVKAAGKLLDKDKAAAQAQEVLQNLQDPVLQNEARALDIKERDSENKLRLGLAQIEAKNQDRVADALLEVFREMAETERAALVAELQKGVTASQQQTAGAQIAADLTQGVIGHVAKLMIARMSANADRNAA